MAAAGADPGLGDVLREVARAMQSIASGQGVDPLTAPVVGSVEELQQLGLQSNRLGATQLERLRLAREQNPKLTTEAHAREVRRDLKVLPGEAWSYSKHAEAHLLPSAVGFHGLRKTVVILAHALDLHRTEGGDASQAFLAQSYKAAQAACLHPQKQWSFGWPLLGLPDPDGPARPSFTPAENSALTAFHRDAEVIRPLLAPPKNAKRDNDSVGGEHRGDGGDAEVKQLRQELEKLRKQLAKGKGKGKRDEEG